MASMTRRRQILEWLNRPIIEKIMVKMAQYFRKGGVGLSFLDILPFFGRNRRAISRNFPLSFELRGRVSLCALLARKTSHFGFSKIATFPKANQLAQFFPLED